VYKSVKIKRNQCRFCGIIGTKKNPVKNNVCTSCKKKQKEFPKEIRCFLCGRRFEITFGEWSNRGNTCEKCDRRVSEKVALCGYRTLPESRGEMEKFLSGEL